MIYIKLIYENSYLVYSFIGNNNMQRVLHAQTLVQKNLQNDVTRYILIELLLWM